MRRPYSKKLKQICTSHGISVHHSILLFSQSKGRHDLRSLSAFDYRVYCRIHICLLSTQLLCLLFEHSGNVCTMPRHNKTPVYMVSHLPRPCFILRIRLSLVLSFAYGFALPSPNTRIPFLQKCLAQTNKNQICNQRPETHITQEMLRHM